MCPIYVKLFNLILKTGIIPSEWTKGVILPIYKNKGNKKDPNNYRGITLLSCLGKLFTSLLNTRLTKFAKTHQLIGPEQAGFRKGYSTTDHVFVLNCIVDMYLYKHKKLYCTFIDYKKAFDSIDRITLWKHLIAKNV